MIRSNKLNQDIQVTDSLMSVINSFGSFDAQLGVTSELINGGKLSLITDYKLRNKLAAWSSILIDSHEDYKARMDHWVFVLAPYLSKHFNLANSNFYLNYSPWSNDYDKGRISKSTIAPNNDFDPLQLENLIWLHKMNNDYVVMNEQAIEDYIDETLEMIVQNQ